MNSKQYKTFAFPNKLTPLETYYYYLLEFGVIPSRIPAGKIVEIFNHAAQDYIHGVLHTPSFAFLSFELVTKKELEVNLNQYLPGLSRLVDLCGELGNAREEDVKRTKDLLALYLFEPKKFAELSK